jgi:sterol desaturase/sphingolipid hydroxylase (fatty acid hydroxylase superfamily)
MDAHLTALAIPLFFLLIGVELLVLRAHPDRRYRLHDSISSLSCGVGQQVLGGFLMLVPLAGYDWVYQNLRVATMPRTPLSWALLALGVDLGYWTYHWASHRVNFLWATHAVHHQSEELNLTTGLRQSFFYLLFAWLFYTPLAALGFPLEMYVTVYTVEILFGFWIHTRAVARLGPLEWIINTPSHHRVHHGVDPKYIDKNYAGVFIFWDRLFGTFRREDTEPVFGVVAPLASWNPLWANLEPWVKLWRLSRAMRRWRDKLYIWIAPPEWRPVELGGPVRIPEITRATQHKYDTPAPRIVNAYIAVGFALAAGTTTALLEASKHLPLTANLAVVGLTLASLAVWSGLAERKAWAVPLELGKLLGAVALGAWLLRDHPQRTAGIAAITAAAVLLGVLVLLCRSASPARARQGQVRCTQIR